MIKNRREIKLSFDWLCEFAFIYKKLKVNLVDGTERNLFEKHFIHFYVETILPIIEKQKQISSEILKLRKEYSDLLLGIIKSDELKMTTANKNLVRDSAESITNQFFVLEKELDEIITEQFKTLMFFIREVFGILIFIKIFKS